MPELFDIWMRLLRDTPGSVLWLIEVDPTASANLRTAAGRHGIDPDRLVFSPKVNLADHLARQRNADLFLDTLPYNAGLTASNALWSGLPVITCLGASLVGRIAASLLNAVGLAELVTKSLSDYEALALHLAHNPARLTSLREKLSRNHDDCPLFNTKRFTRHLEIAYETMWSLYQMREPPESFAVENTNL